MTSTDPIEAAIAALNADDVDPGQVERLGVALTRWQGRRRQAGGARRHGRISGWKGTAGFLVETGTGVSWFVSRDSLPDGLDELPVGTTVTYAGAPRPKPGKRYPEAYTIQHADPGEEL